MATRNSKALKAIAEKREAAAFEIEAADEAMPKRTRTSNSPTQAAAREAFANALSTLKDGESRPFRVSGEKAEALIGALRRVAADENMTIRTAPSATAGATLWQILDKPPVKRTRKAAS